MSYYARLLEEHGRDVRALGWGSRQSQLLRFKVLTEIDDLRGSTVLDFGCGFGDLHGFLLGSSVRYIGYDNDAEMLRIAKEEYPLAEFVDNPVQADYVLESGVFNLCVDGHVNLQQLWDLCRKGVAANFTSVLTTGTPTPGVVYADPFEVSRFCSYITRRFTLRHDYKSNDFTVYLYR